nr:immunoglobulin light chain junction region [Macaca mulatta]
DYHCQVYDGSTVLF